MLSLQWSNLYGGRLGLRDSKTGPGTVWLGQEAVEFLASYPRVPKVPWIFWNERLQKPFADVQTAREQVRDTAGLRDFRLQALQAQYRLRFQTARRSALLPRIIDMAFERPGMTITDIAQYIGVTCQAASNTVVTLVKAGIVTERGSHPKVVVFGEIMAGCPSQGFRICIGRRR